MTTPNAIEPAARWQLSVSKVEEHRTALTGLDDRMPYVDANSGLPAPRGNLEKVTAGLSGTDPSERGRPAVRTLRQAPGYGWSVAIAASPEEGLSMFQELKAFEDPDVGQVIKENRKKARLKRVLEG